MAAVLTVDEMYKIEQDILNKNQNGYLPPDQFNRINNEAQFDYMNSLLGDVRKYTLGRPIPPTAWGMTGRLRRSLAPFITLPVPLSVNPIDGTVITPEDYEMWDAVYWGATNQRVKFLQQGRIYSHVNSTINPIQDNPIYYEVNTGFCVYPFDIGSIKLSYIRTPAQIKWNYTVDPNFGPIYEPVGSVDPEWSRLDCMQVIMRAMRIVGVSLQDADINQYSTETKNVGQ